jgi:hypothetical protein
VTERLNVEGADGVRPWIAAFVEWWLVSGEATCACDGAGRNRVNEAKGCRGVGGGYEPQINASKGDMTERRVARS